MTDQPHKPDELKITHTCILVSYQYDHMDEPDVSLNYTEHSPDSYYSDTETTVDIDREQAVAIIGFLQRSFGLIEAAPEHVCEWRKCGTGHEPSCGKVTIVFAGAGFSMYEYCTYCAGRIKEVEDAE